MSEQNSTEKGSEKSLNLLNAPLSAQGVPVWLVMVLMGIGILYLLNPTAGLLELIPDNLPLVGNLDDAAAAILVWKGIQEILESRKYRRGKDKAKTNNNEKN